MQKRNSWINDVKIDKHYPIPDQGRNQPTVSNFAKYDLEEGDSVLCETAQQAAYLAKMIGPNIHSRFRGLTRQQKDGVRVWKVRRETARPSRL